MKSSNRFTRNLLAAAVAVALPGAAMAQLEEVIVTATKRAESTQDIPMSVQAVSGERLDAMAINDLGDLSTNIPNFSIGDGLTTNLITMRGIGSGEDRSFEQSVSMFVDGIYMPRSRQTRTPFFDADRVEILRGPQAVLFGLNSTAGAISIHSAVNNPGDSFEASITGEYETENEGASGTLIVGGSPLDNLGLRLAIKSGDSGDGYIDNNFLGDQGDSESTVARLSVVWEPTDDLRATAKYNYADYEVNGQTAEPVNRFAKAVDNGDGQLNWKNSGIGELLPLLSAVSGNTMSKPGADQEAENFSLNVDYMLGEHTLTGLFGYSDYDYNLATDLDSVSFAGLGIPGVSLDAVSYEEYEQTSFELRLTSPGGETLDYVVGAYYQDSTLEAEQPAVTLLPPDATGQPVDLLERGNNFFDQDATLWSAFASLTWNITERMRAIGGVRYSDDDKDWDRKGTCENSFDNGANWNEGFLGLGACTNIESAGGNVSSDEWMPELVLQYDLGDDTMVYAKYSESSKSGGAATVTIVDPDTIVFDSETAKGFEAGLKTQFADGMAEFNAVAFYTEFDDLQVKTGTVIDGRIRNIVSNAGEATSQGLELDARLAATDWLTLGGALAYLDAEYDDYKGAVCNTSGTLPASPDGIGCDASGENLPFSPEWTGSAFADLSLPITSGLNLVGNLTVSYSDDYFSDGTLEPELEQESYTKYDASLGLEASSGQWNVSVIGKNLSDEEINMSGQSLGAGYDIAYLMPPRLVVLQATWRFGNF
jgi:outer membrane receptor protein involved in Fe transport